MISLNKSWLITTMALSMLIMFKHPILVLLCIIFHSLNITISLWINNDSSWVPFLLLLVFFGGMMIMFMYICSLATNELENEPTMKIYLTSGAIILVVFTSIKPLMAHQLNFMLKYSFLLPSMMTMILVLMLYLLVSLFVATKITQMLKGPMRAIKN